MENSKTIYIVSSYCGYDDYFDIIECAFENREEAQAYVNDEEKRRNSVSNELLEEINQAIDKEAEKIEAKYYKPYDYDELLEGSDENEYGKEIEEWDKNGVRKFVEDTFNIPYENYIAKQDYIDGTKIGYQIIETKLYAK